MSYLNLPNGIEDFTKATISLWFRLPKKTIDDAVEARVTTPPFPLFNGVVPLLIMGKKGTGFAVAGNFELEPTYLGVFCYELEGRNMANFTANFETCVVPDINVEETYNSVSFSGGEQHVISPDKWYHVLISVEITAFSSSGWAWDQDVTSEPVYQHITGGSHFYIALNDVNYTRARASSFHPDGHPDPNLVVSSDCVAIADTIQATISIPGAPPGEDIVPSGPVPSYASGELKIPSAGVPLGLPGTPAFVNNISQVEMAEFQMWPGKTTDFSSVAVRRAFLDFKRDANGNIITLEDGTQFLRPVNPKKAEELMGAKPEILLHGSGRWIKGDNTGSLTPTAGGDPSQAGDFTPTGVIKRFKPEPVCEKTPEPA